MNSKERILHSIKQNQFGSVSQVDLTFTVSKKDAEYEQFERALTRIGGSVIEVKNMGAIAEFAKQRFQDQLIVIGSSDLNIIEDRQTSNSTATFFEDVDVVFITGQFGVAENGSVWITDNNLQDRALPFICHHLVVVIKKSSIVSNMHEAYQRIGNSLYNYGVFIAGPSKTADIEQSLVIGAHGPKALTVLVNSQPE